LAKCQSESDVFKLAQVQVKNSLDGSTYDYWAQSGEQMIGFFAYALFLYAKPEHVNFANVLNMIQVFSYDAKRIDRWMVATKDERLINRYKSLVATPEKTLLSTLATATNSLAIYNNPNIAAITSRDTLPFDEFRKQKTILYICGSPSTIQFSKSVSASFFESFFSHILQKLPDKGTLPITFLIDEAATMRLGSLPKILELGRKYSVSVATLWQDFNQVEHIFGKNEAANIFANSKLKVFMPSGQPLATCKMLQELLGKYSYTDEKEVLKTRELLTAQEIFQLQEILLLNGNNKPLLLEPMPFFESTKLRKLTELPVHDIQNTVPLSEPTFLNFD
jgi:type IV secretory pathway TraG/TraD family ATPase VirD4